MESGGKESKIQGRCFCHAEKFSELTLGNDVNNYHIYEQNIHLHWISAAGLFRLSSDSALSSPIRDWLSHLRYISSHAARVIVARQQSLVALVEGTDVQCYNYSLPYSFTTVPDVAVGKYILIQLFTILKVDPPTTCFSPLSQSIQKAWLLYPSSSGLIGSILLGQKWASHFWLKTALTWKLGITRLTLGC